MVVTGGAMRTDEVLGEGLGMGRHRTRRELKEPPEEQSRGRRKFSKYTDH
jgi:hypothetical protein